MCVSFSKTITALLGMKKNERKWKKEGRNTGGKRRTFICALTWHCGSSLRQCTGRGKSNFDEGSIHLISVRAALVTNASSGYEEMEGQIFPRKLIREDPAGERAIGVKRSQRIRVKKLLTRKAFDTVQWQLKREPSIIGERAVGKR